MERIGASKARTNLSRLLNHVERGESVTTTRHGKPVALLVPVASDRTRAHDAPARIVARRKRLTPPPLAELMATIHEGHRY